MNIKTSVIACGAAIAATVCASPMAQASPTATNLYVHGTTSMAQFSNWSTCQEHAAWSLDQVRSHGGTLVAGRADSAARWECFPVVGGHWTYLTLYFATKPLLAGDTDRTPRADATYSYDHRVSHPAASWSAAQCTAAYQNMRSRVLTDNKTRLLPAQPCQVGANGQRSYDVEYLGVSSSSGLYGDKAYNSVGERFFQETWNLGYDTQPD